MLQDFSTKYELEIYRYGGEEFLFLAYRYSQEELMDIAEEIRLGFHEINIAKQKASSSLGVTHCYRSQTKNLDSMINLADQAVYIAKNAGRDKVAYLPAQSKEDYFI